MLLQRRLHSVLLAAAMLVPSLLPVAPAAAADLPATEFGQIVDMRRMELAPGATYTWYDMAVPRGPEKMHFVEFDPAAPHLKLQAGTKSGKVYGFQRVTEMADYADAPGNRVIAGINADFFDISGHATGVPNGLFIGDGTILNSASSSYAFGLKADGTAVYGHPTLTKTVTIDGATTNLTHINRYRDANQLVLYTNDYYTSTKTSSSGDEVLLEILEGAVKSGETMRLQVTEVRRDAGDTPLAPGYAVLSASGTARSVLAGLEVGDEIAASFALGGEWNDVTVAVGGTGPLIKDGVVQPNVGPEGVHPRTAIGTKADGTVVMFEIDGRAPGFSEGVETNELAQILKDIGVVDAINLDGGGSSTFVAKLPGETTRRMLNRGSDGGERATGNGLLLVNTAPEGTAAKLVVQPVFERVLAGAKFVWKAAGVDAFGHPAAVDTPMSWSVDPALGTIDAAGVFTAGSGAGEGGITVQAGDLAGTGAVEVVDALTELRFPDASKAFNTGDTVQLTVTALRNGQVVQADNGVFEWRVEGPIGTIDENGVFRATSENSKTGKIFVKYGTVETSMDVEVGTPPVVLEDFEGGIGDYIASGAAYNTVAIGEETNEDFVRFGSKALRLEYDFVGKTGTSGAYLSARSVSQRIQIPGYPEKISMWVYGDGQRHWLRGQIRDGNNGAVPIDFTAQTVGVDWIGWKYVEAVVPKGKPLPLTMDLPVRYMETSNNNKTKGVIYVDQIRALYGPIAEDRTPPIVRNAAPADRQIVKTATPTIKAIAEDDRYDPATSPGTTLIDPASIRLYVDGQLVPHGLYPPRGEISYIPNEPLDEGPHAVKLSVRDWDGNQKIAEWRFYVDLGSPKYTFSTPGTVYAGNTTTVDIKGEKASYLLGGFLEFAFDPSKTEGYEVLPGAKLSASNVSGVLNGAAGTVRVDLQGLGALAEELTDDDVIAQVRYKIKRDAAGENVVSLNAGSVSFEGRSAPMGLFAEPASSVIETQLALEWNYEGIAHGAVTAFTIADKAGAPVEGAMLIADGVVVSGESGPIRSDAAGVLVTDALTQTVRTVRVQAAEGERHSPVTDFTVSALAGTPEPYNISVAMSEDPTTSRRLSWNTNPSVDETVVEVVAASEFASSGGFESPGVRRYEGTNRIYHTNNDGTIRVHKAAADGLKPDTEYVYRVGDGAGYVSAAGTFRTAPAGGDGGNDRTKFLFFGDSQASDAAGYALWRETLLRGVADAPDAEFIVHTGDIVDQGHEEEQWNQWFAAAQDVLMNTTFVGGVGNHEGTGENPDVEGDEGKDFNSHFNFPDNGIDQLKGSNYSFDYKNIHFAVLNSEYYYEEQRDWLREDLAGTDQPWKIVMFHRGAYGSYYSTEEVKTYWTPVFDEFGVDLVLNGHDHLYMKTYPMKGGVPVEPGEGTVYVVGGTSGPKFYDVFERPWQEEVYDRNIQIYSTVEVDGNTLTFVAKAIDGDAEIARFTLEKPDPIVGVELAGPAELTAGLTAPTVVEAVYASGVRAPIVGGAAYGSSDPSVATVDAAGVVTAVSAGTAVITASYGEWSDTLALSVLPPVMTGIEVVGPAWMTRGDQAELAVAALFNNGARVTVVGDVYYDSSEPSVVAVDGKGRIRANKEGSTLITAVYGDWVGSYTLQVQPIEAVLTSIEAVGPTVLASGDTGEIVVTAVFADGTRRDVTEAAAFGSSESKVVSVDGKGRLQAHRPGEAALTVSFGGRSTEWRVTVTDTQ